MPVLLAFVLAIVPATCGAQITTNVFTCVLHLRTGANETATGFTIAVDGHEYLITAKHAVASLGQDAKIDASRKANVYLLDGYNNPRFSGGPLVAKDNSKPGFNYDVIAVVTGFEPEVVPVVTSHAIESPDKATKKSKEQPWRIRRNPDGSYIEYVDTENSAVLNTGIVTAFSLQPAIDLIRKHPEGPEEKALTAQLVLK